jgi:hypothetical protein
VRCADIELMTAELNEITTAWVADEDVACVEDAVVTKIATA